MLNREEETPVIAIPYMHPNVDLGDLQENGKLLSDKEIATIKKMNLAEGRSTIRYIEDYKAKNIDIIRMGDNYFVVYKPSDATKKLGEGSFGSAGLVQNLDTGTFHVLKESKIQFGMSSQAHQHIANREHKALQITEQGRGKYFRSIDEKKGEEGMQAEILMDLAEGPTLESLIQSNPQMPTTRWLDISVGMLAGLADLHQKGIIHRDIKPDNINCDVLARRVTPIDLGLALITKPSELMAKEYAAGSSIFMAPEVLALKNKGGIHTYNGKEDVYSAGKTIADLLDLTHYDEDQKDADKKLAVVSRSSAEFKNNTKISNPQVRALVLAYLQRMTDADPDKRPTMAEAKQFFEVVKDFHLDLMSKISKVGFLNLAEYEKAEEKDKEQMLQALQAVDEVCLLDKNGENKNKYVQIKKELEEKGLSVRRDVVQHDGNNLAERMASYINKKGSEERMAFNGFLVTKDPDQSLQNNLQKKHIMPVAIAEGKDYKKEIQQNIDRLHVSPQHFSILTNNLAQDIARLAGKYKAPRAKDIQVRIDLLTAEKNTLQDLNAKNELNYGGLYKRLDDLQNQLLAKSPLKQLLEKHTSYISLTSRQTVLDTMAKIHRDVPGFKK